ncbi:hypothetical protein [Mycolicibacterium gilvum]|uniref:hypothetical protein n=1 Tax=Mycolicibacterium gilvum TaxID=1804 RepID=UPI0021F3A344|nr:hypothetical protein [Mycolicibacterium gilvum]MCV7053600.1 hypothetical protein [Mycolicibacterium gilvum]
MLLSLPVLVNRWAPAFSGIVVDRSAVGTTDAVPMLLSLPVLVNRWAPAFSGIVVDRSAVVSAVGPVKVATSEHALFRSDSVLVRATWRIGWNVVRPERCGTFGIALPGS